MPVTPPTKKKPFLLPIEEETGKIITIVLKGLFLNSAEQFKRIFFF